MFEVASQLRCVAKNGFRNSLVGIHKPLKLVQPSYTLCTLLSEVKTGGCLLAVFEWKLHVRLNSWSSADYMWTSTASSCLSRVMMSAKRCGLDSLLLNKKGPTLRFTKLISFMVNGVDATIVGHKDSRAWVSRHGWTHPRTWGGCGWMILAELLDGLLEKECKCK